MADAPDAQKANSWRSENQARYSNPRFDALFDNYVREVGLERRAALAIQMNDLLVGEAVAIPLVARTSPTAARSRHLGGVQPNPWESSGAERVVKSSAARMAPRGIS